MARATNRKSFDALMNGENGYAPLEQLVDIDDRLTFDEASEMLRGAVGDLLIEIEERRMTPIEKFSFGRTYANPTDQELDQRNFDTWTKDGVNDRWRTYNNKGYDGLVVLCALVRNSLPIPNDGFDQHSHAVALKTHLIVHFGYFEIDTRLDNDPFFTGSNRKPNAKSGVLFMAYKLKHDKQATQKQPVEQKQAKQNEHVEEKQAEQNEPVEQKQAEQYDPVEQKQAEQNEPVEKQVEGLVNKLEDVEL